MAGPVTVDVTEAQQIEEALHALVTVAVSDIGYAGNPLVPDRPQLVGELLRSFFEATDTQRAASRLIARPVGAAVRAGISTLARRLFEIGGAGLLHDTLDRVASRDPAQDGDRESVLNACFDGIGGWAA